MKLYDPGTSQKAYKGKDGIYYLRLLAPLTCRTTKNCYKTLEFLGRGGNGSVYLTLCVSQDSENQGEYFALKFFQRRSSNERLKRFQEEIEFLKIINHPNIIKYYDDGLYDVNKWFNLPFFISSYMPQTLNKAMESCSKIYCLMYATQLLSALKKLNQAGIIHRDIKPQNIFVNGLSVVLGDFGLMKKINNNDLSEEMLEEDIDMISHSRCIGQPFYYRCPDIIDYATRKSDLTTKSDIFQLGLVFAEMFGGKNPLKPANNLSDPIEFQDPLLGLIKGTNANIISELIKSMLELDPNNRPEAHELLNNFIWLLEKYSITKFNLDGQLF